MSLERRLREHFDAAGSSLSEPEANLAHVVKRGRRRVALRNGAVAAGTLAVATVAVLGFQGLSKTNIDFAPATPAPPTTSPTPAPSDVVIDSSTAEPSESPGPVAEMVSLEDLGAPVIAYGGTQGGLRTTDTRPVPRPFGSKPPVRPVWSERVDAAFPDGNNGVVFQTGARDVIWLPDSDPDRAVPLDGITALAGGPEDSEVTLRGVEAAETVIFSTRPTECCEEGQLERFYAAPLEGGAPQLLVEENAHESSYIGPVPTVQGRIISSCHLMCALWPWPGTNVQNEERSPYDPHGGLDGLTATPDGGLIAFLESGQTTDENSRVELVILDGVSFEERARLALPVANETPVGAVVSVSADGQRILASLEAGRSSVPQLTLLIDGALTDKPVIRQVDYRGVVRWLKPSQVQLAPG